MNRRRYASLLDTAVLTAGGLLLNLLLSGLVSALGLPLYLDSIGTILTSALAGVVPGMIVGFLTNLLLTTANGMAAYYGVLNVAMAIVASHLSIRGAFKTWRGRLIAFLCFFLIGGVAGGFITYALYGAMGVNTSVGLFLVTLYQRWGASYDAALILTEMSIDFVDKLLVMVAVVLALTHYPRRLAGRFEFSWLYDQTDPHAEHHYRNSVSRKWTVIVGLSVLVMGLFTIGITVLQTSSLMIAEREKTAQAVANHVASYLDGDRIEEQLALGEEAEGYAETRAQLQAVMDAAADDIRFLYVYTIREDGVFAVYDLDVPELQGVPAGTRITNDPDIFRRLDEFLSGEPVAPGTGNFAVNTAVSAYTPVKDSTGKTVAYACADISAAAFWSYLLELVGKEITLMIAISLILMLVALYLARKRFVRPLEDIIHNTQALSAIPPEQWLDSEAWKEQVPVHTGDELEALYHAVTDADRQISLNVQRAMEIEAANMAKTQFLARMSHDMRTPLNGILGLTYIMEDASTLAEVKQELPKLRDSGEFLLQLVNDVLDVNKIESGEIKLHPTVCDEKRLFDSIIEMVRPRFDEKHITFDFQMIHIDWTTMILDEQRVKQIFINLLTNAAKFTPEGGKVELIMELIHEDETTIVDRFIVRDNGIGMDEAFLPRLFTPFAQENRVFADNGGSGLGLCIVKSLVELMNGTITVKTEKGKGTEFTLYLTLPLARDSALMKQTAPVKAMPAGIRILLCEDHPLNAQIAMRLLEKQGAEVVWRKNGQEGVDAFAASPAGGFDLILMDIQMPVMNGLEAARAIRALPRADAATVPIAAMTANAYNEDKEQAMKAGMNAHLAKPFNPQELYATIQRLVTKR